MKAKTYGCREVLSKAVGFECVASVSSVRLETKLGLRKKRREEERRGEEDERWRV